MLKITISKTYTHSINMTFVGKGPKITYKDREMAHALLLLMDGKENKHNPHLREYREQLYDALEKTVKTMSTQPLGFTDENK